MRVKPDFPAQAYSYLAEHAQEEADKLSASAADGCANPEQIDWNQKLDGYYDAMYKAFVEGFKLGSQWTYHQVFYRYDRHIFIDLVKKYGPAPQDPEFRKFIASFLAS